jgi:hypothetical protein
LTSFPTSGFYREKNYAKAKNNPESILEENNKNLKLIED